MLKSNEAKVLLEFWFDQWMKGTLDPELQLDVWLAVENSSFSELKSRLNSYKKQLESKSTVQQYSTSLFGGNVQTGKTIFSQNSRAQCMRCHILNGEGGEAGPDLTGIAGRLSREELLLSLVEPDARLAPGYGAVIVNLTNGKEVAGLLLEEQEQFIRIRDGQRIERRIDRSEIEKMEILPSGMLNMKGLLSRDEIRDLMAFLVTLE